MSRARTQSHRRPALLGVLLVIAIIAAAGAFLLRISGKSTTIGASSSVYTEAVAGQYQRINPVYASLNAVDADLSQLIFSGLVKLGPDGAVQPGLAALPQVSTDGTVYTFKLRPNLQWQDGTPVTSADVAFTVKTLVDPDFKGDSAVAEGWLDVAVATPDARTVVVTLKQASAPFLARSATVGILPQHLLNGLTAQQLFEAPFNSAPIGTGPYKLQSIDSHGATLVANSSYQPAAPKISTIKLRFYADYSSALRALQSGDVNGLMVRDTLTEQQVDDLKKVKGMKLEQPEAGAYVVLYLNNDQAAFFADARVRQAISLALDRQTLVQRVYFGIATPSSSPVAPGSWAYAKQYDKPTADIAQAKALLKQAGWTAQPDTGILVKAGQEFRFTIRTDDDPTRVAVANEIARQLDPLGIKATVASTTFTVLRRDFLQDRKYDAAVAAWDQGPDPDPYFGWHSSQTGQAGLNLANYANAISDDLIAKGRTTNDDVVRKDVYTQFQQVWSQTAPSVVVAYPQYLYAHTASLQGVNLGVLFDGSLRFSDVASWHE
ncbi:MAG TPA: peptide ABC transporter substrate-binding protein [Tepidiformaceae bacterium]|nr:peptide ABC transporter substrate-binding protein [Tepidiformaceae bacterium]